MGPREGDSPVGSRQLAGVLTNERFPLGARAHKFGV